MKVLLVAEPGVDGVFRHVEGLCRFLFSRDVAVHLAYSSERGSDSLRRLVDEVRARGGETLDLRVGPAPGPADVRAFVELRRLARLIRPDVVHTHSSKAGILGRALALFGVRARYFYTAHAYYGMGGRRGFETLVFNAFETAFARVGTTIAISDDEAGFAKRRLRIPPSRIHVIPNPVDTAVFHPPAPGERNAIRARFGIPEYALVLGTVGRLSFQKDPATLYRAVAKVMATNDQVWLCHVGRGELEEELRALAHGLGIAGRLVEIPYLEEPAEIYRAFDAFALTSLYEAGWPLVVLEALASDLPVIVTSGPGTADLSQGGLTHCWTAARGDADGFAEAIESWLDDVPNRRPMNHRRIVEERFSGEVLFGSVYRLYAGR